MQGRVRVGGTFVTNPLARVIPERAQITVDGERARKTSPVAIVLNKPRGYVTTRSDPEGRNTVYDLLEDLDERVVPIGRLDLATSGLLLFTNDTQFANWVTDPVSKIPRVYLVTVAGRVTAETAAQLTKGIVVDGERLAASTVEIRKTSNRESHLTLTLTEGKNREIRRLMTAAGHRVTELRRVQFGGLTLGTLAPGKWRRLSDDEVQSAFPAYRRRLRR